MKAWTTLSVIQLSMLNTSTQLELEWCHRVALTIHWFGFPWKLGGKVRTFAPICKAQLSECELSFFRIINLKNIKH